VTSERAILFIAEFDDVKHAHAAQQVRALERLGARVTSINLKAKPSLLGRLTGRDLPKRMLAAIDEHSPELVVVIGGEPINEELLEQLRGRSRARWVNWLPDDLRTVVSAAQRARPYDHIYAIGTDVAADIHDRLARTVDVLAFAADPSVYRPLRTRGQYRANVVFAGSATARRERLLSGLTGFGLALWGPGWRSTSLKDYCRGEMPSTAEYINACGGASVTVNIHHLAVEGGPHEASCNQRVFELAAMGAAQVVDERGDLPRCFEAGKEVAVYHDFAELREVVRELLENPTEAERLGQAARARLLQEHTYMHRMKALLDDQPRQRADH
jgi:spore maturation protein CgeB